MTAHRYLFQSRTQTATPWSALGLLLLAGLASAGSGFELRNPTFVSGGSVQHADGLRMVSSFGEPVMGTSAAGPFRLTAGFPATLVDLPTPPPNDRIFANGFEMSAGADDE